MPAPPPDQLQRPGAPVLPAQRARTGRHPGQPGGQASASAARATRSPARRASRVRGDRQAATVPRQGRRSAAGPAGACRPSWPKSTGPTTRARSQVASKVRADFDGTRGHRRRRRQRSKRRRQDCVLHVAAEQGGAARRGAARYRRAWSACALAGQDVTPLHDAGSRNIALPVRLELPRRDAGQHRRAAASSKCARATASWCRCRNWSQVTRRCSANSRSITRTCCRWSMSSATWPASSTARCTACSTSRARSATCRWSRAASWRVLHQPAGRPLCRLRHQVGRRMADHLRNLPRHGRRLRGRPGPDLPAGGGAVQVSYLVPLIIMAPIPLTIIGVMPGHALLGASSPRPR